MTRTSGACPKLDGRAVKTPESANPPLRAQLRRASIRWCRDAARHGRPTQAGTRGSAWTRTSHPSTDRELGRPMRVSTPSKSTSVAPDAGRGVRQLADELVERLIAGELSLRDDATVSQAGPRSPPATRRASASRSALFFVSSQDERYRRPGEDRSRRGSLVRLLERRRNCTTQSGHPEGIGPRITTRGGEQADGGRARLRWPRRR